jgi:hypothetical protein
MGLKPCLEFVMADSILEKNLASAREAVANTRKALWIGAGNFWNDTQDPGFVARMTAAKVGISALGPSGVVMAAGVLVGPEGELIAARLL